jgi:hypothetical protein
MKSERRHRSAAPSKPTQSLSAFMLSKARTGCLICQLPREIRDQLGSDASRRGFTRQDQVDWLRGACGVTKVTLDILNRHLSSRHDREEESNGSE